MSEDKLKKRTLLAYTLPAIPNSALGLPISVYLPPFYAMYVGLDLAVVGLIFMLMRFWDIVTDPVLGILSDRFNTRWGRRKPWVVAAVPIMMVSVWQLFFPPEGATGFHLGLWLFLMYLGYTMLSISHMSWGTELANEYHQRSRIHGWRENALVGGMLFVLILPTAIQVIGGGGLVEGVHAMGLFIIITLPVGVFFAAMYVPDDPHHKPESVDWAHSLKVILKNKILLRILVGDVLAGFAPSVTGALYFFYIVSVADLREFSQFLLLLYFVTGLGGISLWMKLSYTFGKHKAMSFGMLWGAITLPCLLLIPTGSVVWMAIGLGVYGLAYGAGPFLLRAIMSDVTDQDRIETGQQRTGLYFSLLMISSKLAGALSVGVTYVLLDYIGFNKEPGATNTPEAIMQLEWMYVAFPTGAMLLAALVMWNFPLDQTKQRDLRNEIDDALTAASTKSVQAGD
jgi:glycoside/pentoside/hexuronide:cation symporter, GPH family